MNSVESWLRGAQSRSSWSSSKCTKMHTSQTHTKPNRSQLHLTGVDYVPTMLPRLFQSLCLWKAGVRIIGGTCRGVHAKTPPSCWWIEEEEESCQGSFHCRKLNRRFRTKLSPLALTMQGWHTDLFVRIRGRTVTSAGELDRMSLWTKYECSWISSVSY